MYHVFMQYSSGKMQVISFFKYNWLLLLSKKISSEVSGVIGSGFRDNGVAAPAPQAFA